MLFRNSSNATSQHYVTEVMNALCGLVLKALLNLNQSVTEGMLATRRVCCFYNFSTLAVLIVY